MGVVWMVWCSVVRYCVWIEVVFRREFGVMGGDSGAGGDRGGGPLTL